MLEKKNININIVEGICSGSSMKHCFLVQLRGSQRRLLITNLGMRNHCCFNNLGGVNRLSSKLWKLHILDQKLHQASSKVT